MLALAAALLITAAPTPTAAPASAPVHPASAPGRPAVIVNPDWLKPPTGDEMAHAYPPSAMAAGVSGKVVLTCKVRIDGGVDRCVVTSEDPPGWGFAEATLKVAQDIRMRPQTVDGVPVDGAEVAIPIRWSLGDFEDPQREAAPPAIAEAQARDPEALVYARRIADLTASMDWASAQITLAYGRWIYPQFDRHDPARSAAFAEAFRASIEEFAAERHERVAASLVFTLRREDLKEIKTFLETHAGAAFVNDFPRAMARSYGRSNELLVAFVDGWQARYCAKVACDDRDLNSFSTLRTYFSTRRPPVKPPEPTPPEGAPPRP